MTTARCLLVIACFSVFGSGGVAGAQTVDLAGLWPHENGRSWTYDASWTDRFSGEEATMRGTVRLWLDGSRPAPGGVTVQWLWGDSDLVWGSRPVVHDGSIGSGDSAPRWQARPDLRPRSEQARGPEKAGLVWPFTLLGPAGPNEFGVGLRATEQYVGVWRDAIANWSWIYLPTDLAVGARFTLQLLPDLLDSAFLHTEVQSIVPSMSLPAGLFENVLVMSYRVDRGPQFYSNVNGEEFGPYRVETTGTMAFAMGEGPIHMEEQTQADLSGCPECPLGLLDEYASHGELTLARRSVPVSARSFGALKAEYEP